MTRRKPALAIYSEMPEFRPPIRNDTTTDRFAENIYAHLPIARAGAIHSRQQCLRLASDSHNALGRFAAEVNKFFDAIFKSGVRPTDDRPPGELAQSRALAVSTVSGALPAVQHVPVRSMPLAEVATATAPAAAEYYREECRRAARSLAERTIGGLERLIPMMAVGLVEHVAPEAARVVLYRDGSAVSSSQVIRAGSWPSGVTHPYIEAPDTLSAQLFELVEVRTQHPFRSYRSTPRRVYELLAAVPTVVHPLVTGLTGRLIREGSGRVNPRERSAQVFEDCRFECLTAVVFADEYVLALWREGENTSLLTRLFGI